MKLVEKSKKGFTLLEIIIATAIIVIATGFAIGNFSQGQNQKALDQEVHQFVDTLELAQKKATAGDVSAGMCSRLSGYGVNTTSSSQYELRMYCTSPATSYVVNTYSLPTQEAFTTGAGSTVFKPLSQGITPTSATAVIIKSTTLSTCVQISISSQGSVTIGSSYSC